MKYLKHPATIIATVALFIAFGGGAAAYASGLINGSQIKNHSIAAKKLTNKALKQLKGNRGPAGPAGPQGIQGIQGIQGVPGAKGDPGAIGPSNVYSSFNPGPVAYAAGDTVVSLTLAAGNYFVTGDTTIYDGVTPQDSGCYLDDSAAGGLDAGYATTTSITQPGDQASLSVMAPLTTTGSTVTLDCVSSDGAGNATAYYAHLAAIKVGSVTGSAGHFSKKIHSARVGN